MVVYRFENEIETPSSKFESQELEIAGSQFEIVFVTKLGEPYQIAASKFVLSGEMTRLELSEIVNESLTLNQRVPFDFIINNEFLRGSLSTHCVERGITSEKTLEIEYVLAMDEPQTRQITQPQNEWISGISSSETSIFTCSVEGVLAHYEKRTGTLIRKSVVSSLPLTSIAYSEVGVIITGGKDGFMRFSSVPDLDEIGMARLDGAIEAVSVCPFDQTLVLSGSSSGRVHLWNVPVTGNTAQTKKRKSSTLMEPRVKILDGTSSIVAVAWLSLSRAIAASEDGTIYFFDPMSTEVLPTVATNRAISSMGTLGESKIITGHPDGRIVFWEIRKEGRVLNLEAINSCRSHTKMISSISSRPGSNCLAATSSLDGCLKLFDSRASHYAVQSMTLPPNERALVVSWLDETCFASGGSDGILRTHTVQIG
jgi:ribosome biogenesis protein YTM1